jgi:hypothetical protein
MPPAKRVRTIVLDYAVRNPDPWNTGGFRHIQVFSLEDLKHWGGSRGGEMESSGSFLAHMSAAQVE